METIRHTRMSLYEKVWNMPMSEICSEYELWEEGLEEICRRLNVPFPSRAYWQQIKKGKKPAPTPLPSKPLGVDMVTIYLRHGEQFGTEHRRRFELIREQLTHDTSLANVDEIKLDKVVLSTKEGQQKKWEVQHDQYWEKNKMLAVYVSPEQQVRALMIMDLLIKTIRLKKHDLIIEGRSTIAIVDGERIEISLGEKKKRIEYTDEYNSKRRDLFPNGTLFLRREDGYYSKKEWRDGTVALEDQILQVVDDLESIASVQKEERIKTKIAQEERARAEKIKQEFETRQRKELTKFRQLLFDAHRFSVSTMLRAYADQVEKNADLKNILDDETKNWLSWARNKADWFDPTVSGTSDELLNGIDIESLKIKDASFSGYYYNSGTEQTKDNFWKPWWSR